jgi:MBG domain (YGX type)
MISNRCRRDRRTTSIWAVVLIAAGAMFLVGSTSAYAMGTDGASTTNPWISSDQADYAPGSTVTLTGGNWAPGESVHIIVDDTTNHTWQHSADVTADDTGRIQDVFSLPNVFVSDYDVSATGSASGNATTTFTDANPLSVALGAVSQTIAPGGTADYQSATVTFGGNSTSCTVLLSAGPFPTGATPAFGTASLTGIGGQTPSTSFKVNTTNAVVPGTYNFTVTATRTAGCQGQGSETTSGTLVVAATKANQTISFGVLGNKTFGDAPFTVSATGGGSGNPVTFSVGAADNCTSGGTNGATITITGAGSCTVTANQAGNQNYNAATAVPQTFSIAKATPTVSITWADWTYDGTAHPASGSVTGVGGTDLGAASSISYYNGSTASGSPLSGAPTHAGDYSAVAHVNATANYTAADSAVKALSVTQRTLTIKADDQTKVYGDVNPAFTGSISGVQNSDPVTLSFSTAADASSGVASYAIVPHAGGTPAVLANYSVDATNGSLSVTKATPSVSVNWPDWTFDVTAHAATGSVTGIGSPAASLGNPDSFTYYSGSSATGTPLAGAPKDAGIYTVVAHYNGSDNYTSADSDSKTVTVSKADQTITFPAIAGKTFGDADFDPGATASSTLTVTYTVGAADNCTVVSGKVHITGAGSCTVTAHQAGNNNYNPAGDVSETFSIAKATPTVSVTWNGWTYDGTVHAAAGAVTGVGSPGANLGNPGTFTYYTGSTATGTPLTGAPKNAGTYTVVAHVNATTNYTAADSTAKTVTVAKATPVVSVTWNSWTFDGNPHPATGSVSGVGSPAENLGAPTSFTYYSGTTATGTPLAGAPTAVGTYTVVASYATTGNYNPASATKTAVTVTYRWDGFLQPINDTAHQIGVTESLFKLGSTVPVKFQLKKSDGTVVQENGTNLPTFTRSANRGVCDPSTSAEGVLSDPGFTGSAFRWDSTAQQYIYNFSTKGLTKGEYRIFAALDDGTSQWVDICLQ